MAGRFIGLISGLSAAAIVAACQTTAAPEPVEAVLKSPSAETTERLSAAASEALGGVGVTLAPSVLTTSSTLTLETKIPQTMNSNRNTGLLNDRARPAPDVFKLMMTGESCYLYHEASGKKMPLAGVDCKAL